ncbi:glucohydrolase [Alphaproteobacteria bacterium GH1-50]|uniref:Glucohydrolase n=1 Tax=Kangsaoukella pontilimi TaxID=2691042 RepID=A0A7C9IKT9_9RHOB|nr:alpha-glucosidase [Kangsaoukella pontilimi]MXQ09842.1 glucohydrolase [Kangsaoukella pontilimi]
MTDTKIPWWKTATGYQIYPRSFADSNGDGIGDLPGIISKLDHLADLGVGFIWLCPIYASPMRDNGYDIADYYDIAPEFGTLEDFDRLVAEARARGIRIVMDLVVNHCSSDHEWFRKACETRDCPEHDYFYWRDAQPDGSPPDDQRACFGGSAWQWVETVGRYCYCHFGPQQPDLNWHNPALRQTIYEMMNWWLDRGIGGFRMDVIELVGKDIDARHYYEGPDMHRFIQEMHQACLAGRDVMTVGESWSVTPKTALDYCGRDRAELDMVFGFNHIQAAWDPAKGRFGPNLFDLRRHKAILADWQYALADDGWNSLYLSNHDLPRPVSHYACDGEHRVRSAKMLATVTYLMKGTAFVFQGEEIGMTNVRFERLDQFRDIETLGQWTEQGAQGVSLDDFIAGANANARDHARTPMQWTAEPGAGFSGAEPWMMLNPNHVDINAARDRANPEGVFEWYRKLIALRRSESLVWGGAFELLLPNHPALVAYLRTEGARRMLVMGSYSGDEVHLSAADLPLGDWQPVLANADGVNAPGGDMTVPPYFAGVWIEEGAGR